MYIGLDFSLNAPGLCALTDNGYKWVSFSNYQGRDRHLKPLKSFYWNHKLAEDNVIDVVLYDRISKGSNYQEEQQVKLDEAQMIANMIVKKISELTDDPWIGIEGYSYGSKGNSFIDLITFGAINRHELNKRWPGRVDIYSPSSLKMKAGKGNYNKFEMFDKFQENVLDDPILSNDYFWKTSFEHNPIKEVSKPFEDLIDSYFALHCHKDNIESKQIV